MTQRVRLGELLVEARIISEQQLEDVLEIQKADPRRLGTLLVEAGLVTETQVTQILSQQLSVPWVSLYHIDFSRKLLNLVPHELAERHGLVPIFVRRVRGLGQTLYVAMDDPSDDIARAAVAEYSGLPVRAMIAPPSEIRAAIAAYYVVASQPPRIVTLPPLRPTVTEPNAATVRAPSPPPTAPELGCARDDADSLPDTVVSGAPAPSRASGAAPQGTEGAEPVAEVPLPVALEAEASTPSDDGADVGPRRPEIPAPRRGAGAPMITLTLLDGTQITLPARPGSSVDGDQSIGDQLTARDLVEALRASLHGADATEILGDSPRWERLVAALLSVLLKKHLVADWEFVDEYSKLG